MLKKLPLLQTISFINTFAAAVCVLISKANMRMAIITCLKSALTEMEIREEYYSEDVQTGEQIIQQETGIKY